jgi:antitoxin VapB
MQKALVTTQGQLQSVQLPEGFHLRGKEVYVKKVGKSVLLIPVDADLWDVMEQSLEHFTDDFLGDRNQPPQQQREELSG